MGTQRQRQRAAPVLGARWEGETAGLREGLREWRASHPHATLAEMEAELDRRWYPVRAGMLADLALASQAADLQDSRPTVCPDCGGPLRDEGQHTRRVVTWGNERVVLTRDYATCTACDSRVFPLDDELGLLPHQRRTPRLEEMLARLGTSHDFAQAADLFTFVTGVGVSEATARRRTYAAGTVALAQEEAEIARIERDLPAPSVQPQRMQISVDATKVPLVGGAWTEIKLAVLGDLEPAEDAAGQPTVAATHLSYAARWEEASAFERTLLLETHRRGLSAATDVASPNDGAKWIAQIIDAVAPQAVRILDEPHSAEHLGQIGALVFGPDTLRARTWVDEQRDHLRYGSPCVVLAELQRCHDQGPCAQAPTGPQGETPAELLAREVAYFQTRASQIEYQALAQALYPLGSGIVESGHKVVIGARFKGAGQHWAPHHLNPLVVLRTILCSGRWTATWPLLTQQAHQQTAAHRCTRAQRRRARQAALAPPAVLPPPVPSPAPAPPPPPRPVAAPRGRRRPSPDHVWYARACFPSRSAC